MNVLRRFLAWAAPTPRVPQPRPDPADAVERRERHRLNAVLAQAWQRHLENQVARLDAHVRDLSVELELHELEAPAR